MTKTKTPPQVLHDETPRILVPNEMPFREAGDWCHAKAQEQEEPSASTRSYDVLPWAGAYAVEQLLNRSYSAVADGTKDIDVPTGGTAGKTTRVRWGKFRIASLGTLTMSMADTPSGKRFTVTVVTRRMNSDQAEKLLDEIRTEIAKGELYRGSAIILEPSESGELKIERPPRVMTVKPMDSNELVLPERLKRDIEALVFDLIRNPEKVERAGYEVRSGHLCAGRPGTGKTMTGRIAAWLGVQHGWTVFYLPDARAVENALTIAQAHQPAILICEDLDRQLGGERTALTDRILNSLNGLDTHARVVFIATTNDDTALPAPLLRPGRMDSVHRFGPPDAGAATELLRRHLNGKAPEHLELAGAVCAGLLPAAIKEVARRAVLLAMHDDKALTVADLEQSAEAMWEQQRMLERAEKVPVKLDGTYKVIRASEGGHPVGDEGYPWDDFLDESLVAHAQKAM